MKTANIKYIPNVLHNILFDIAIKVVVFNDCNSTLYYIFYNLLLLLLF